MDETQLPDCKGSTIDGGGTRECPAHRLCDGEITDWMPPLGLSPDLREYRCSVNGHAFYINRKNQGTGTYKEKMGI